VLGRGGGGVGSSPKRSICCWGFGMARGGPLELPASRCDAERSICTFSCTFFNGCLAVSGCLVYGSNHSHSPYRRRTHPGW